MRILYVDDRMGPREAFAALLRADGYAVTTAATLEDGLCALSRRRFDVVFTSQELPDGSGEQLLRLAQKHHALRDASVAVYTASPERFSPPGPTVIPKGLAEAEVLAAIRQMRPRHAPGR